MKILFLTYYFEPDLGAGAFRNSSLLKEIVPLLKVNDSIDIVASYPNRYATYKIVASEYEEREGNVKIHRVKLPTHTGGVLARARASISYYFKVLGIAKKEEYDIIYASSSRLMTAFLGAKIARMNKNKSAKLYLDIRDIFRETILDLFKNVIIVKSINILFKAIENYTFKRADHINLVSEGFLSYFEKYTNCNYTVFTNGIDDIFFNRNKAIKERKVNTNIKTIVYAGNIGEGQGLETIIPKVAKGLEGRFKFIIYGDGGTKHKLVKELEENNISNVKIYNPINRDQLIQKYLDADYLFLHLNEYKAFERVLPSKLFEYGVFDKPIIAGVSGYPSEFLKKEMENIILFSPGNHCELINELDKYNYNNKLRESFIKKYLRLNINRKMALSIVNTLHLKDK